MSARLGCEHVDVTLGGRRVIDDASASFEGGHIHAVVGRSGAGKSVLMKAVVGLVPMSGGLVRLACDDGACLEARAGDDDAFALLRARAVFVHQDPALLDDLSVEENIGFALVRKRRAASRVDEWLARLSLDEHRARLPRELTPGALRRVALCRALVLEPEVLVIDEPTTGLDPVAAREVDDALLALAAARGSTLIVITHDVRSLDRLAPTLTFVDDGKIAWRGALDDARGGAQRDLARLLEGRAP